MNIRLASAVAAVLFLAAAAGCGGSRPSDLPQVEVIDEASRYEFGAVRPPTQAYLLATGDAFDVDFLFENQLSTRVVVRPDGAVALPIVGDVRAAGRTPAELDSILTEAYSAYFRDPDITVNVLEFAHPAVYVLGEVKSPGEVELTPGMTMLQALALRGGPIPSANMDSVILLRRISDTRAFAERVDLSAVLHGRGGSWDLLVAPYDIIFVPPTFISQVSRFVGGFFTDLAAAPKLYLRTWEAFNTGDVYDTWQNRSTLPTTQP